LVQLKGETAVLDLDFKKFFLKISKKIVQF